MDALDVRILRALGLQPFLEWPRDPLDRKPSHLAARLGVSTDTVKDRIARMEADRVIEGYEVYPNFRHLGCTAATHHFKIPDPRRKTAALHAVEAVDGVVGIFNFAGPDVCIDIAYRDEQDRTDRLRETERLMQAVEAPYSCFAYHPPSVDRRLDRLDWQIIQALRGDAHRPYDEVGARLGVSGRTIRRRFERMLLEGSLDVVPVADPARSQGIIVYEMVVSFGPDATAATRGRIESLLADELTCSWSVPDPRHAMTMLLVARSLRQTEEARRAIETVPGVAHAEVLILLESRSNPAWIDTAIMARIEGQEPATLADLVTRGS